MGVGGGSRDLALGVTDDFRDHRLTVSSTKRRV